MNAGAAVAQLTPYAFPPRDFPARHAGDARCSHRDAIDRLAKVRPAASHAKVVGQLPDGGAQATAS